MAVNEIARVYAASLVEVGQENNMLDQFETEMKFLAELFQEDRDLRLFLMSPGFSKESKRDLINKVFAGKLSEKVTNFLNLLVENDRQSSISDIYEAMTELIDEVNNRQRVTVVTRESIDDASIDKIKSELTEKYKKDIIIKKEINENLLGGIIIKVGDLVIDGSLVKDLKNIRNNLLKSKIRSDVAYED